MKIANRLSIVSFIGAGLLLLVIATAATALHILSTSTVESLRHSRSLSAAFEAQTIFHELEMALAEQIENPGRRRDRPGGAVDEALEGCRRFVRVTTSSGALLPDVKGELQRIMADVEGVRGETPVEEDGLRVVLLRDAASRLAAIQEKQQNVLETTLERGQRSRTVAFAVFFLAAVMAFGGMLYLQRRYALLIIKPVLRVSRAASRMAEGNLDQPCPVEGPEELARLGVSLNDLASSLKKKMGELREALVTEQMVVRQLAVLNDIASLFFSELDLDQILNIVVKSGRDLVKAEYSLVFLVDDTRRVTHYKTMGIDSTPPVILQEPPGLLGHVLEERMPLRLKAPFEHPADLGIPDAQAPIRNILALPILVEGRPIGEFLLANRVGAEEFSEQDEDQVLHFSFLAAVGIEKAMLHQEVLRLAQTDGLTGLMNHKTFQERMAEEISRCIRHDREAALLLIDIDHFKRFNDSFGHQAGDEILKRLAGIFEDNIRAVDCAARYGGEEFALIFSETGITGATKTATRIIREVRTTTAAGTVRGWGRVTVSAGLATYPDDGQTREDLFRAADRALYEAKRRGRDRLVVFREMAARGDVDSRREGPVG